MRPRCPCEYAVPGTAGWLGHQPATGTLRLSAWPWASPSPAFLAWQEMQKGKTVNNWDVLGAQNSAEL